MFGSINTFMEKRLMIVKIGVVIGLIGFLPSMALAAHNTVTFDANTNIYLWGVPATLSIVAGGMVAGFIVESSQVTFQMEDGSSVTIFSSDRYQFTNTLNTPSSCGIKDSSVTITSASMQDVVVSLGDVCPTTYAGSIIMQQAPSPSIPPVETEASSEESTLPGGEPEESEKPISQMTADQIKAEIIKVAALIAQLQEQLRALPGVLSEIITADLRYGSTGAQVELLQQWLAKDPVLYPEGIVSGWFGPLTKGAVVRFQEKHAEEILSPWNLTKGTGYVGRTTKDKLNALYSGR